MRPAMIFKFPACTSPCFAYGARSSSVSFNRHSFPYSVATLTKTSTGKCLIFSISYFPSVVPAKIKICFMFFPPFVPGPPSGASAALSLQILLRSAYVPPQVSDLGMFLFYKSHLRTVLQEAPPSRIHCPSLLYSLQNQKRMLPASPY